MLVLTSYDNLTEALPGCMNIPDTNQFECYVGVFMEHHLRPFLSLHGILPTPSFTPDYAHRLETLCGSYSGIIALACWKEMGNVYTSVYGYGAELVFSKCDNAPTDETRNECKLKSVEIIATNENNFNRSEKLQELCDLYSGRVESCISRVLSSQIESSLAFAPISSSFCADLPKYADWCFEELITKLHTRAKDASEFMAWCNKLDQTHVERCKQM